ncbi:MAG: amidohydrolase family protein [Hyphomonadaceae bacterium]|nr:amidohydrolase family protein [Hyphomonadaceae bacterium]
MNSKILTTLLATTALVIASTLSIAATDHGKAKAHDAKKPKAEKTAKADAKTDKGEDAKDEEKWDISNPPGDKRDITIDTESGTWMSLDVSPDGETIAFDLLGDIYTMPIEGGKATSIATGMAWEIQPRFSPDGARIVFTSDRGGGDNIWTMETDGSDMQQVTDESFRLLNNPTWSPDGRFIAARKHFTTSRSLGTGEIWLYHATGGSGVKLVKRPDESHQKELGEPMFAPDGKSIYFSQNTTPGGTFIYAQDSNTTIFEILEYDMETGETSTAVSGFGGSVRPTPSPDGTMMAFVRRERAKSKLYLKDMQSGKEWKIFDDLDQDMQETWAVHGVYPNMDWLPDGSGLIFWAGGEIHKYDLESDSVDHIPFKIKDTRMVLDPPRPKIEVSPDTVEAKMIKFTQVSPDGDTVVFEAFGKLYKKSLPGGDPVRLTDWDDNVRELHPAWSRDGEKLAFVKWTDAGLGSIHVVDMDSGDIDKVSKNPGHYSSLAFSPDGDTLVFDKSSGGYLTSPLWSGETGLFRMPSTGGKPVRMSKSGSSPHFGPSNDRVYFTKSREKTRSLVSTDLNGHDERVHASSKLAQMFMVSPTGENALFRQNYNLFMMPILPGPQSIETGPKAKALPVTKVSQGGSLYPSWSGDGETVSWSLGPTLYSVDTDDVIAAEDFTPPDSGIELTITRDADRPDVTVAIAGARIITMADEDGGIIKDGTIIIENGKIIAVGEADDIDIPEDAETVNASGKTIMPGFIDAHAHGAQGTNGLIPEQNWSAIAHLALGVTTIFDPSSRADLIFAAAEMQQAGMILAPRTFSTGEVIYGAKAPGFFASINSEEDAQEHISRLKAQGAYSVKNYNQPRREQRQQVVTAAREANIAVVAEGGSLFHMDMSMVADGNTGIEHNLPQSDLYDDVIQMYSQTKVGYTPTINVTYGGVRGEDYWYQMSDVWKHPILSKHVPDHVLQPRAVRRQMAPESDYTDSVSAATAKKLLEAGVPVSIGAHGQREGLGAHWEIWSFERGGMSPLQALQTATIIPAKHLGYDDDIGSLEPGKLADLIILSENPLKNIRNTDQIEHVMLGGRLYEADTMNEVVTGDKQRAPYYWETE